MSRANHLIVDGTNIVHAWPDLRAIANRNPATARSKLWQSLIAIHDEAGVRITLVFDGRGETIVVDRPFKHMTFSVVYTPSALTADDVIEHMVANSSQPSGCCVATDDNAERDIVAGLGAETMRSDDLAAWLKRIQARQSVRLETLQKANSQAWTK